MKLTTKYVENVRPDEARREIADGGCAGLYLLLQPSGHRSWAVRYRVGGRSAKLTIGSWPEVSLLDARVAAAAARKRVKQGEDPAAAKAGRQDQGRRREGKHRHRRLRKLHGNGGQEAADGRSAPVDPESADLSCARRDADRDRQALRHRAAAG